MLDGMFENLNLEGSTLYLIIGCVLVVGALVYFKFFRNNDISCSVVDMQNASVDVIDADESNEQSAQVCDGEKCYIPQSHHMNMEEHEQ